MSGSLKSSLAGGEGEGEDQWSSTCSLTFGPLLGDHAFSTFFPPAFGPFVEDQWSSTGCPPADILVLDQGEVFDLGFGLGFSDCVE